MLNSRQSLLATTTTYPNSITQAASSIRSRLPSTTLPSTPSQIQMPLPALPTTPVAPQTFPDRAQRAPMTRAGSNPGTASSLISNLVVSLMTRQESLTASMAQNLESLTSHYEQMSGALRDHGSVLLELETSPTVTVGSAETYKPPTSNFRLVQQEGGTSHEKGISVPRRLTNKTGLSDDDMQSMSLFKVNEFSLADTNDPQFSSGTRKNCPPFSSKSRTMRRRLMKSSGSRPPLDN